MELIADGLLIATAMTAGLYCLVLSRRLRRLTDSGNSIGPQIEALDRALGDTREALAETREGVLELRSSTKSAFDELTRETTLGKETADLIERGVKEAKATMQRLYEAADRIEAYENRQAKANLAGEGDTDGPPGGDSDAGAGEEALPDAGDDPATDGADDNAESTVSSDGVDSADGPKVALPEGKLVDPEAAEAAPVAPVETAGERTGTVLKAERVML